MAICEGSTEKFRWFELCRTTGSRPTRGVSGSVFIRAQIKDKQDRGRIHRSEPQRETRFYGDIARSRISCSKESEPIRISAIARSP